MNSILKIINNLFHYDFAHFVQKEISTDTHKIWFNYNIFFLVLKETLLLTQQLKITLNSALNFSNLLFSNKNEVFRHQNFAKRY